MKGKLSIKLSLFKNEHTDRLSLHELSVGIIYYSHFYIDWDAENHFISLSVFSFGVPQITTLFWIAQLEEPLALYNSSCKREGCSTQIFLETNSLWSPVHFTLSSSHLS